MGKLRRFEASIAGSSSSLDLRLEMRVDGVHLLDHIREAERPLAAREGVPALAGNYTWPLLTPRLIRLLNGERPGAQRAEGVLLNCECGSMSCWPLSVRVRVIDRFVVWQDLRQLKRLSCWDYAVLDPLRFDRTEYLDEMARIRQVLLQSAKTLGARRRADRPRATKAEPECAF